MSVEIAVASTALFITTAATAIALWECVRHKNGVVAHSHINMGVLIPTNDIRLNGQDPPVVINEGPSHAAHMGPSRSDDRVTYFEMSELDSDHGRNVDFRQAEDQYSNAV